jgi:hypothetical protein
VYVDICQRFHKDQQNTDGNKRDLLHDYKFVYDDYPFPGSSIGPIEHEPSTGTHCGYITHNADVFALTSHHVVSSSNCEVLGSNNPYRYMSGQKKHIIVSPSDADHL